MPALAKAKRAGLARHIGVANFNIALLDQAIKLCPEPLVALQAEYHPYLDQSKLIAASASAAWPSSPIARSGAAGCSAIRCWPRSRKARGRSIAQIALRWLMQQGIVRDPALVQARSASPTISRCPTSRCPTTRWRASPRCERAGRPHRQSGRARQRRLGLS